MFTTKRLGLILLSILFSLFIHKLLTVSPERRGPLIALAVVIWVILLYLWTTGKLSQEHLIEKAVDVWQKKEDEEINEAFRKEHTQPKKEISLTPTFDPSVPKPTIHDDVEGK